MLTVTALGQIGVALSPALAVLASAAAVVALTSVAAQILVPFAAHLARDGEQGKTISTVMSGLLVGVLLSRVVAGVVADVLGWRAVFTDFRARVRLFPVHVVDGEVSVEMPKKRPPKPRAAEAAGAATQ